MNSCETLVSNLSVPCDDKYFLHLGCELHSDGESFAVVSLTAFRKQHEKFKCNLPGVQPLIPVKVNPDPVLLSLAIALGCGFDLASEGELDLVLQYGANPRALIFSNTIKMVGHMKKCALSCVRYATFDSFEELQKHAEFWPNAELILRIAIEGQGKFGAPMDLVSNLLEEALRLHLNVVGVHFHVGCLANPNSYEIALANCRVVIDKGDALGFSMEIVNIGGGFSGIDDHFLNQAAAVNRARDLYFSESEFSREANIPSTKKKIRFLSEPGTFYFMSTTTIACQVISARKSYQRWTQSLPEDTRDSNSLPVCEANTEVPHVPTGGTTEVKEEYTISESVYGALGAFQWEGYRKILQDSFSVIQRPRPNTSLEDSKSLSLSPSIVYGCTQDWADVIYDDIMLPQLQIGDLLLYKNAGAYCLCCARDFNGFRFASMPRHYIIEHDDSDHNQSIHETISVLGHTFKVFHQSLEDDPWSRQIQGRPYLAGSNDTSLPALVKSSGDGSFPRLLSLDQCEYITGMDVSSLALSVRELLDSELLKYGAVVLRNLPLFDPKSFSDFIAALGWSLKPYIGGVTSREEVAPCIYAASDEDSSVSMDLHQDNTYWPRPPTKLFFYYEQPAAIGGLNPLLDMRAFISKLPQNIVDEFETRLVRYQSFYPHRSVDDRFVTWQQSFQTESRDAVEDILRAGLFDFEWTDRGLQKYKVLSPFKTHPKTNEKVWSNMIQSMHASYFHSHPTFPELIDMPYDAYCEDNAEYDYPFHMTYGDGSEIPSELIALLRRLSWEEAVAFKANAGDLLVIDNFLVQHGRLSYQPPRKLWLGISLDM